MKYRWSELGRQDALAIRRYIAVDNPAAAQRLATRIADAARSLTSFPGRGRSGKVHGTRELVISGTPYIMVYQVAGDIVEILRVFHGAQLWPPDEDESR